MSGYFVHGGTQYPYGQAPQQDAAATNSGQLPYYGNAYSSQQVASTTGAQYSAPSESYDQSTAYPPTVTEFSSGSLRYGTSYDSGPGGNFLAKNDRYSSSFEGYGSIGSGYSSTSSNNYRNVVGQGRPGSKNVDASYGSQTTVNAGVTQAYSTGGSSYNVTSSFTDEAMGSSGISSQSSYEKALHNAANQYYSNRRGGGRGAGGSSGRGNQGNRGGRGSFTQPAKSAGPKPIKATEVKAYLYAWCGQRKLKPVYDITSHGTNNKVVFQCKLMIEGLDHIADVFSSSKKDSQTKAAWDFCEHLVKQGFMKTSELPKKPVEVLMKTVGEIPETASVISTESKEPVPVKVVEGDENSGGWTISNSRQRLHQFCQRERIHLDFVHTNHGPEHAREFDCGLTVKVSTIQKELTAIEKGHNKKQAAALCALNIVRQLYSYNLIEKFGDSIKYVTKGTLMGGPIDKSMEDVNRDTAVPIKQMEGEQVTSGMKRKAVDQPSSNVDEFGNWTAENSRQRLRQFCETNRIPCDVLFTEEGVTGIKTYTASLNMKILPEELGEEKLLEAVATGKSKKDAAVGIALQLISQLYKLSLIEPNPKKKLHRSKFPVEYFGAHPSPYFMGQLNPDGFMFSSPYGGRGVHRTSVQDVYLNEKHRTIYPQDQELEAIQRTVKKIEVALKQVSNILDVVVKKEAVGSSMEPVEAMKVDKPEAKKPQLQGVMRVGSLAKGLLLKGDLSVELVLMCEEAPTAELLMKVAELVPKYFPEGDGEITSLTPAVQDSAIYMTNLIVCPVSDPTSTNTNRTLAINIALYLSSRVVRTPKQDGESNVLTLNKEKCLRALAELRHTKWFQTCANGIPSCVIVIRIILEMKRRLDAWKPLSDWAVELLVEKSLSSSPIPLSLGGSFVRVLEVISSGIFLPNGIGIRDPCEKENVGVGENMTVNEREALTAAAQHALRLTVFKKPYEILGMDVIEGAQPYNKKTSIKSENVDHMESFI